jgi:hypothetical protein
MDAIVKLIDDAMVTPESANLIVGAIKLVDPKFKGLASISDTAYAEIQSKIINAMPQDDFNKVLVEENRRYMMPGTLKRLSSVKLKQWLGEHRRLEMLMENEEYGFVDMLVSKDVLPEDSETKLINKFIQISKSTILRSPFILGAYKTLLRTMLVVYDGRYTIDFAQSINKIALQVITQHLTNQVSLLKMETSTKEALSVEK